MAECGFVQICKVPKEARRLHWIPWSYSYSCEQHIFNISTLEAKQVLSEVWASLIYTASNNKMKHSITK